MIIKKDGKFVYVAKKAPEYLIKQIIVRLAYNDSKFAKNIYKFFHRFKVKVSSNDIKKISLNNYDFANFTVKYKLTDVLSKNDLREVVFKYPSLALEVYNLRPNVITEYNTIKTLISSDDFVSDLLKNKQFVDSLSDDFILSISLKSEVVALKMLQDGHISKLRTYEMLKVAQQHPAFAFELTEHQDMLSEFDGKSLTSLSLIDKRIAKFVMDIDSVSSKISRFTEVLIQDKELALYGMQKNVPADWVKIANKFDEVLESLYLHPDIFTAFKDKDLLPLGLKNSDLAVECLNHDVLYSFVFTRNTRLSFAHEKFTKRLYELSLHCFSDDDLQCNINLSNDLLNLLIPYKNLVHKIFNNTKYIDLLISKLENAETDMDYDQFLQGYFVDPISTLKKIDALDIYSVSYIAEHHLHIALELFKHKDIMLCDDFTKCNSTYYRLGIVHTEFAKQLLAPKNQDILKKIGINQIFEIALNNNTFALHLLGRVDLLKKAPVEYLIKFILNNLDSCREVIKHDNFMRKIISSDSYLLPEIAKNNEEFALLYIEHFKKARAYSIYDTALKYEKVALAMLSKEEMIKGLWFTQAVNLAKAHNGFAMKMLDSKEILATINDNDCNYEEIFKIDRCHDGFAEKLVAHKDEMPRFFRNICDKFLSRFPQFAGQFINDKNISIFTILDAASQNKEFALSLLQENRHLLAKKGVGYNDPLRKICLKFDEFAVELLNHPELFKLLYSEDITTIATSSNKFLEAFVTKYNLWDQLYGRIPKKVSHEKLVFDLFLTKQVYDQQELAETFFEISGGAAAIASGREVVGSLIIICAIACNPQVIEYMEKSAYNDPYFQHMPKDDAVEAVLYSTKVGGESSDMWECVLQ